MVDVTTFPIHPGQRLLRRLKTVFTAMMSGQEAFTGVVLRDETDDDEATHPCITFAITASTEKPVKSETWQMDVTVSLVEDRVEANTVLITGGDSRPRHEWRHENISARLYGRWNLVRLPEELTAVADDWGLHAFLMWGGECSRDNTDDGRLITHYEFTILCASSTD
jgi:hypothetical protein